MDINQFRAAKGATFYRIKNPIGLSDLKSCLAQMCSKALDGFHYESYRKKFPGKESNLLYSFVMFKYEKEPSFLRGTSYKEVRFGFVLIIENEKFLVVLKRGGGAIAKEINNHIEKIESDRLRFFMSVDALAYSSISYENMSASDRAVRKGTIEALNCAEVFPVANSHRKTIRGYKIDTSEAQVNIIPTNSSIRQLGGSESLFEIMIWVEKMIEKLEQDYQRDGFFSNFAQGVKFSDIPPEVKANGIFFDLTELENRILDEEDPWTLCFKDKGGNWLDASSDKTEEIFRSLKGIHHLAAQINGKFCADMGSNGCRYQVSLEKKVRGFGLSSPFLRKYRIKYSTSDIQNVESYISKGKHYSISFNNPSYFFTRGDLYLDIGIGASTDRILSVFIDQYDMANISSEKGILDATSTEFSQGSLFHLIENEVVNLNDSDNFLACDDLGDEWADYIGFSCDPKDPSISFFHAKHKHSTGTGASPFHDVVGQALKNLGRVNIDLSAFEKKLKNWKGFYSTTRIKKIRTLGSHDDIISKFKQTLDSPYVTRGVYLVVSFVSKSEVKATFQEIKNGKSPAHISQLVWLLSTFISECMNVGARPFIVCRP